jgi:Concanavalin A-like lectin/glucanases superfamily
MSVGSQSWTPSEGGWWTKTTIGTGYGGTRTSLGAYWAFFKGSLDDVRIYNRALGPQEVQQLYNAGR